MPPPSPMLSILGLPGGTEWLVILVVVLLLFGNRIPGMARSLGSGIVEFKKGLRGGDEPDDKKLPPMSKDPASKDSASKDTA